MAQRMNSVEDLEQQQQLRGPREHIQLNRLNSRQESAERQRIRAIFDRVSKNNIFKFTGNHLLIIFFF